MATIMKTTIIPFIWQVKAGLKLYITFDCFFIIRGRKDKPSTTHADVV
jgi:hypothetical protein